MAREFASANIKPATNYFDLLRKNICSRRLTEEANNVYGIPLF